MAAKIPGDPIPFPQVGTLSPADTVLLVIDMQHDFCSDGGYMSVLGADMTLLNAAIAPLEKVLRAARGWGCHIAHTREGYAPDLSDLQPWKHEADGAEGHGIGNEGPRGRGLIRGDPGWNIVEQLAPELGEPVFDKTTYGAFASTDIDDQLRAWNIKNVILTGVTTDCCVTSCLREALDRGYDCCVVEDCVGTSSQDIHDAALALVRKPGGVFGTTVRSGDVIALMTG